MRVLVVEDEAALREALKADLVAAGYTVDLAADGEEGLYAATEYPIDVAIIDLGLPKLSGLDLIRQLRARGKTYGVLILTARDRWQDKVEGLSAGADDYVAKPFHFAEVQARLAALLRRAGGWASAKLRLRSDRARYARADGDGAWRAVELTSFEYRILEHLMLRAGEVISKTELTDRLYEQDYRPRQQRGGGAGRAAAAQARPRRHAQADRDPARARLSSEPAAPSAPDRTPAAPMTLRGRKHRRVELARLLIAVARAAGAVLRADGRSRSTPCSVSSPRLRCASCSRSRSSRW